MADTNVHSLKRATISRECQPAIDALRKISINPTCKVSQLKLVNIARKFMTSIESGKNSLNDAIPNIDKDDWNYSDLSNAAKFLTGLVHDIQEVLHDGPEAVKAKLISILEILKEAAGTYKADLEYDALPSKLVDLEHDFIIYGLIKLRYEASLFDKTNKELKNALADKVGKFDKIIQSLPARRESFEVLRAALKDLLLITARNVQNTGIWLEVNPKDVENRQIVKDVYDELGKLFGRIGEVAEGAGDVTSIKTEFSNIYRSGWNEVCKLVEVTPNSIGSQDLLRNVVLDGIVIPDAMAEKFKGV